MTNKKKQKPNGMWFIELNPEDYAPRGMWPLMKDMSFIPVCLAMITSDRAIVEDAMMKLFKNVIDCDVMGCERLATHINKHGGFGAKVCYKHAQDMAELMWANDMPPNVNITKEDLDKIPPGESPFISSCYYDVVKEIDLIETQEDGFIVLHDDIFNMYGHGPTIEEAKKMYYEMLIDHYIDLEKGIEKGNLSDQFAKEFELMKQYVTKRPLAR